MSQYQNNKGNNSENKAPEVSLSFQDKLKLFGSQPNKNKVSLGHINPRATTISKVSLGRPMNPCATTPSTSSTMKETESEKETQPQYKTLKEKCKIFEVVHPESESKPKSKKERIKLEEKGNLTIYEYQADNFSNSNSKILLIIGNAQNDFINTFINIYSNISYKDKERFSIKTNNNKEINTYFISYKKDSKPAQKITIISIPYLDKDDIALKKSLIELFEKKSKISI